MSEAVPAPGSVDYSFVNVEDRHKAITTESPEGRGGTPTIEDVAPDPESMEEVDASTFFLQVVEPIGSVIFT